MFADIQFGHDQPTAGLSGVLSLNGCVAQLVECSPAYAHDMSRGSVFDSHG